MSKLKTPFKSLSSLKDLLECVINIEYSLIDVLMTIGGIEHHIDAIESEVMEKFEDDPKKGKAVAKKITEWIRAEVQGYTDNIGLADQLDDARSAKKILKKKIGINPEP